MKPLWIVVLSLLALIAIITLGILSFSRALGTISDPADAFFEHLSQGDHELAYEYLVPDLSGEESRIQVRHWLDTLELDQAIATNWTHRYRDGNSSGTLEGFVTLADGRERGLRVVLSRPADRWLISGLLLLNLGETLAELQLPLPDREQAGMLIHETMQQFADSARAGDLADFYAAAALAWQATMTLEDVNQAFRFYIVNAEDWTDVIQRTPEIVSISRLGELELQIEARYQASAGRLEVRAQYWPQNGQWALMGLRVEML
jgi:hypothetical protein